MSLPRLPLPGHSGRTRTPLALPGVLDALAERWWRLPPRARTVVAGVVVLLVLALVGRGATTSPWGSPREVLVAATELDAGQSLTPDRVRQATWPAALVPHDALTPDDLPTDARLQAVTTAGTVLTRRHVVAGIAGLVRAGQAAVAVPLDGLPSVIPGDRVDVVSTTPDGTGHRLASDAGVLAVDDGFLWLGVDRADVEAVAAAGAAGRLTLAVRGTGSP